MWVRKQIDPHVSDIKSEDSNSKDLVPGYRGIAISSIFSSPTTTPSLPLPSHSQSPKMNPDAAPVSPDGPLVAHSSAMTGTTDVAPATAPSPTAIAVPGTTPDAAPVGTPSPAAFDCEQVEHKEAAHADTITTDILS